MLSRITYICCCLLILYVSCIFNPKWHNKATESTLGWDASTYYWYLPATFIYQDLKQQKFGDSIIQKYGFTPAFGQSFAHESGNRVITYSSGVALVQLPAFAIAHVVAKPLGYEADGFSKPYQVAVQLWSIIIGLIGLWFFRKLLLLYFTDRTAAIVLVMLVAGTNYLNYAAIDATITHSYLFTIYTLLLLSTHRFYVQPNRRYGIGIGLLTGLAIFIRPSEIVAVLIPLLWGMERLSLTAFKEQLSFFKKNITYITIAVCCAAVVCSVQVAYWLYVTGEPIVYSYNDKTFSWWAPHTWQYLTSSTSGWLMYNPMILFVLIGIPVFIKYGENRVAILSFFLFNLYIVSTWDVWWYSGIGGRAMIQSYAVILLIAGTVFEHVFQRKLWLYIAVPFFMLFIYINIWVLYHAHRPTKMYDTVHMSKRFYWSVIGRWKMDSETLKLQDARNIYRGTLLNKELIYLNDFEAENNVHPTDKINGEKSLYIKGRSNSEVYTVNNLPENKDWVRFQCTYKSYANEWDEWSMMRTRVHFKNKDVEVLGEDYKPQRFLQDFMQETIYYDIKIPEKHFDRIEVSFLNENSDKEILVDDLTIRVYNASGA